MFVIIDIILLLIEITVSETTGRSLALILVPNADNPRTMVGVIKANVITSHATIYTCAFNSITVIFFKII